MIFVVSGSPGAGKRSVSRVLAQRFSRGVHVPVDDLRELVVSGVAHPVPTWTDETARQFRLASEVAAFIAQRYSSEGFVVVVDNVVFPNFDPFVHLAAHRILLRPSLEALHCWHATRHAPTRILTRTRLNPPSVAFTPNSKVCLKPRSKAGWCWTRAASASKKPCNASSITSNLNSRLIVPDGLLGSQGHHRERSLYVSYI